MNKITMLLGLLLAVLMCNAQSKGKIPTKDFQLWVKLNNEKLASDGKWISFTIANTSGKDTLLLLNTVNNQVQKIPSGRNGNFSSDANWFTYNKGNEVVLIDLNNNKARNFSNNKKAIFCKMSGRAALLSKDSILQVFSKNEKNPKAFSGILDIAFNKKGDLALATAQGIELMEKKETSATLLTKSKNATGLLWDDSDENLFYFEATESNKSTWAVFNVANKKGKNISEEKRNALEIEIQTNRPVLSATEIGKGFVFAKTTRTLEATDDSLVEVWESLSPLQYYSQKELETSAGNPKMYIWDLENNELKKMVADSLLRAFILPNRNYVLAYNPINRGQLQYANPVVDYYLYDTKKDSYELLLKSQTTAVGKLMPSPDGRYLGYFNQQGWNLYDLNSKKHSLILDRKFMEDNTTAENENLSCYAWSEDGRYCVLSVGTDFWLISHEGNEKIRMTNTAKAHAGFRLVNEMHKNKKQFLNEEIAYRTINQKAGIYFTAYNPDKSMSLYKWTLEKGLYLIYKSEGKIAIASKDEQGKKILLREETAQKPPIVILLDTETKKSKVLYQSNLHHTKYDAPRVELMAYNNNKGQSLNALLHYPVGYDKAKKYPMIVYIYETLSQNRQEYNFPSEYHPTGFPLANYTNDGYFVLQPDIKYNMGDPGESMFDCVMKGVESALGTANIDFKRIGIIGHSYGGHETALLITKTPFFAVAVSGAASTNMISDYLSLNEITNEVKFWKFEVHQYRMGTNPFDNIKAYSRNSPVMNAQKINTPLLSWSGKSDGTVDFRQSVELHLALKRLQKKNRLLAYPNEGHILTNPKAQLDLTQRIKAWFDEYLK